MMKNALALAVTGLLALSACGERTEPPTTTPDTSEGTLNPGTTLTEPVTDRPVGQADAEEPETGTNSGRPDAPRDLKPGTDGNTNPPAP
jgi:hypothetical protein